MAHKHKKINFTNNQTLTLYENLKIYLQSVSDNIGKFLWCNTEFLEFQNYRWNVMYIEKKKYQNYFTHLHIHQAPLHHLLNLHILIICTFYLSNIVWTSSAGIWQITSYSLYLPCLMFMNIIFTFPGQKKMVLFTISSEKLVFIVIGLF